MSCVFPPGASAYINVGSATKWRAVFGAPHRFSLWLRAAANDYPAEQREVCLVSLCNEDQESFAVTVRMPRGGEGEGEAEAAASSADAPLHGERSGEDNEAATDDSGSVQEERGAGAGELLCVVLRDVHNRELSVSTRFSLFDDFWHHVEVIVDAPQSEVRVRIDGSRLAAHFMPGSVTRDGLARRREAPLSRFAEAASRFALPSHDLIGARFRGTKGGYTLTDHFVGRVSDIGVCEWDRAHDRAGPAVHWWPVTVHASQSSSAAARRGRAAAAAAAPQQSRTIRDRAAMLSAMPLHLHCADTTWDAEDRPPFCLALDSSSDRSDPAAGQRHYRNWSSSSCINAPSFAVAPFFTELRCQQLCVDAASAAAAAAEAAEAASSSQLEHNATAQHHPASLSASSSAAAASADGGATLYSISMLMTTVLPSDDLHVFASLRTTPPLHLVANIGGVRNLAVVFGDIVFISLVDVTDGAWHAVEWTLHTVLGVSFRVDSLPSTWKMLSYADDDALGDGDAAFGDTMSAAMLQKSHTANAAFSNAAFAAQASMGQFPHGALRDNYYDGHDHDHDDDASNSVSGSSSGMFGSGGAQRRAGGSGVAGSGSHVWSSFANNETLHLGNMSLAAAAIGGKNGSAAVSQAHKGNVQMIAHLSRITDLFHRVASSAGASQQQQQQQQPQADAAGSIIGTLFSGQLRHITVQVGAARVEWRFDQSTPGAFVPAALCSDGVFMRIGEQNSDDADADDEAVRQSCGLQLHGSYSWDKAIMPRCTAVVPFVTPDGAGADKHGQQLLQLASNVPVVWQDALTVSLSYVHRAAPRRSEDSDSSAATTTETVDASDIEEILHVDGVFRVFLCGGQLHLLLPAAPRSNAWADPASVATALVVEHHVFANPGLRDSGDAATTAAAATTWHRLLVRIPNWGTQASPSVAAAAADAAAASQHAGGGTPGLGESTRSTWLPPFLSDRRESTAPSSQQQQHHQSSHPQQPHHQQPVVLSVDDVPLCTLSAGAIPIDVKRRGGATASSTAALTAHSSAEFQDLARKFDVRVREPPQRPADDDNDTRFGTMVRHRAVMLSGEHGPSRSPAPAAPLDPAALLGAPSRSGGGAVSASATANGIAATTMTLGATGTSLVSGGGSGGGLDAAVRAMALELAREFLQVYAALDIASTRAAEVRYGAFVRACCSGRAVERLWCMSAEAGTTRSVGAAPPASLLSAAAAAAPEDETSTLYGPGSVATSQFHAGLTEQQKHQAHFAAVVGGGVKHPCSVVYLFEERCAGRFVSSPLVPRLRLASHDLVCSAKSSIASSSLFSSASAGSSSASGSSSMPIRPDVRVTHLAPPIAALFFNGKSTHVCPPQRSFARAFRPQSLRRVSLLLWFRSARDDSGGEADTAAGLLSASTSGNGNGRVGAAAQSGISNSNIGVPFRHGGHVSSPQPFDEELAATLMQSTFSATLGVSGASLVQQQQQQQQPRGAGERCLFSIHSADRPYVEAQIAVFLDCRLDQTTSPRRRVAAPGVVTFILSDSVERFLCGECPAGSSAAAAFYDGNWHKLCWCVADSATNSCRISIDDTPISDREMRWVAQECPRTFGGDGDGDGALRLVCSLGVRDEGIHGRSGFYRGFLRQLMLFEGSDESQPEREWINWRLDEARGNLALDYCRSAASSVDNGGADEDDAPPGVRDAARRQQTRRKAQQLVGDIVDGQWQLAFFPPQTPLFSALSSAEISPLEGVSRAPWWSALANRRWQQYRQQQLLRRHRKSASAVAHPLDAAGDAAAVAIPAHLLLPPIESTWTRVSFYARVTSQDEPGCVFVVADEERRPLLALCVNTTHLANPPDFAFGDQTPGSHCVYVISEAAPALADTRHTATSAPASAVASQFCFESGICDSKWHCVEIVVRGPALATDDIVVSIDGKPVSLLCSARAPEVGGAAPSAVTAAAVAVGMEPPQPRGGGAAVDYASPLAAILRAREEAGAAANDSASAAASGRASPKRMSRVASLRVRARRASQVHILSDADEAEAEAAVQEKAKPETKKEKNKQRTSSRVHRRQRRSTVGFSTDLIELEHVDDENNNADNGSDDDSFAGDAEDVLGMSTTSTHSQLGASLTSVRDDIVAAVLRHQSGSAPSSRKASFRGARPAAAAPAGGGPLPLRGVYSGSFRRRASMSISTPPAMDVDAGAQARRRGSQLTFLLDGHAGSAAAAADSSKGTMIRGVDTVSDSGIDESTTPSLQAVTPQDPADAGALASGFTFGAPLIGMVSGGEDDDNDDGTSTNTTSGNNSTSEHQQQQQQQQRPAAHTLTESAAAAATSAPALPPPPPPPRSWHSLVLGQFEGLSSFCGSLKSFVVHHDNSMHPQLALPLAGDFRGVGRCCASSSAAQSNVRWVAAAPPADGLLMESGRALSLGPVMGQTLDSLEMRFVVAFSSSSPAVGGVATAPGSVLDPPPSTLATVETALGVKLTLRVHEDMFGRPAHGWLTVRIRDSAASADAAAVSASAVYERSAHRLDNDGGDEHNSGMLGLSSSFATNTSVGGNDRDFSALASPCEPAAYTPRELVVGFFCGMDDLFDCRSHSVVARVVPGAAAAAAASGQQQERSVELAVDGVMVHPVYGECGDLQVPQLAAEQGIDSISLVIVGSSQLSAAATSSATIATAAVSTLSSVSASSPTHAAAAAAAAAAASSSHRQQAAEETTVAIVKKFELHHVLPAFSTLPRRPHNNQGSNGKPRHQRPTRCIARYSLDTGYGTIAKNLAREHHDGHEQHAHDDKDNNEKQQRQQQYHATLTNPAWMPMTTFRAQRAVRCAVGAPDVQSSIPSAPPQPPLRILNSDALQAEPLIVRRERKVTASRSFPRAEEGVDQEDQGLQRGRRQQRIVCQRRQQEERRLHRRRGFHVDFAALPATAAAADVLRSDGNPPRLSCSRWENQPASATALVVRDPATALVDMGPRMFAARHPDTNPDGGWVATTTPASSSGADAAPHVLVANFLAPQTVAQMAFVVRHGSYPTIDVFLSLAPIGAEGGDSEQTRQPVEEQDTEQRLPSLLSLVATVRFDHSRPNCAIVTWDSPFHRVRAVKLALRAGADSDGGPYSSVVALDDWSVFATCQHRRRGHAQQQQQQQPSSNRGDGVLVVSGRSAAEIDTSPVRIWSGIEHGGRELIAADESAVAAPRPVFLRVSGSNESLDEADAASSAALHGSVAVGSASAAASAARTRLIQQRVEEIRRMSNLLDDSRDEEIAEALLSSDGNSRLLDAAGVAAARRRNNEAEHNSKFEQLLGGSALLREALRHPPALSVAAACAGLAASEIEGPAPQHRVFVGSLATARRAKAGRAAAIFRRLATPDAAALSALTARRDACSAEAAARALKEEDALLDRYSLQHIREEIVRTLKVLDAASCGVSHAALPSSSSPQHPRRRASTAPLVTASDLAAVRLTQEQFVSVYDYLF